MFMKTLMLDEIVQEFYIPYKQQQQQRQHYHMKALMFESDLNEI